ncbi:hypothetical protein VM1G_06053 [Cytospora mali]|uniref:Uncharacterized protein n=1 Tax=Cytospora mali TaxID=578113 RepID=A0A194W0R1_CYTMA|nr:hypothetical protein VM1G_06053 [Valsa mali]
MSNYRHGWRRPAWRGRAPGRELTEDEENVFKETPFMNPQTHEQLKPTNKQLGYFITGMEEEDPSAQKSFSDKYLRIHNKKYQSLALRPRKHRNFLTSYYVIYPRGLELPKPSTMEEAGETICVFYPGQPNLLLKAPLILADPEYGEKRKEVSLDPNKEHPLFDLLVTHPALCERILNDAGYLGMAALSQSCKLGMETVSGIMCLFDLASGDFANSEYTVLEHEMLSSNDEAVTEDIPQGYKVLQVSSGYLGFDPTTGFQKYPSYEKIAQGIVRLTRSFRLWGRSIEHLYLTKVPFMDVKVLGMWLQEMPNLKTLTIFRCEHIRLFDMVPLLDMVHNHREAGSDLVLDVAPFYELGPRHANFKGDPLAWDNNLRPTYDRKGTFGVTFADPGVKIHAAVVEYLFYELLPKLEATDQMHLMSLDSMLRNYFERLPLPEHATLRTMKAYEGARKWFNRVESHPKVIAAAARQVEETVIQAVKRPEFPSPASLPKELRKDEAWERIRCYFMLAYAAFGDENPHLQTAADSCMSSNAPLRPETFGKWGEDETCSSCKIRMPCMFFPNACICDKDRLRAACAGERDHLKQQKKFAIEKLGCGYYDGPVRALEDTNIDFTRLYDVNDVSRLQRHSDFDTILNEPNSTLSMFYDAARTIETADPTGLRGRYAQKQRNHP